MSGGHFDYIQHRFEDIAQSIDELIKNNDDPTLNEWGEPNGYHFDSEIIEKFRETAYTVRQAAEMVHRVDYLVSGDDGEESFKRRWNATVREYYKHERD